MGRNVDTFLRYSQWKKKETGETKKSRIFETLGSNEKKATSPFIPFISNIFSFFFSLDKIGLDIPRGPWQKLNFSVSTEFKSSRILVSIGDILTRHSTASPHETLGHSPPPHLGKETVIRSLTTLVAGSMPALIYRPSLRRGGGIKKWN